MPKQTERAAAVSTSDGLGGWQKTPPVTEGHYWVRSKNMPKPSIIELEKWGGKVLSFHGDKWRELDDSEYWQDVEWWTAMIKPPNKLI